MTRVLWWGGSGGGGTGDILQDVQMADGIGAMASPPFPLANVIPSYPYQEYYDDPNIVAFFSAYNSIAQMYLEWFNLTPLAVYTNPTINGPLLDWIANGIYGISRPVFSSLVTKYISGINAFAINSNSINGKRYFQSGTATVATDDYYKRVLTWWLYIGFGRHFDITRLRAMVARFLYGSNGGDITLSQTETVHITAGGIPPPPAPVLSSIAGGSLPATVYGVRLTYVTPLGQTLGGPPAQLSVAANHVLVVQSPPAETSAIAWDVYMNKLPPGKYLAGINSGAINGFPVNGSNGLPVNLPTLQNGSPIAIGTNWTEPDSGWVYGASLPSTDTSGAPTDFIITIPNVAASLYFQQAINQGILALPFQLSAKVIIE